MQITQARAVQIAKELSRGCAIENILFDSDIKQANSLNDPEKYLRSYISQIVHEIFCESRDARAHEERAYGHTD